MNAKFKSQLLHDFKHENKSRLYCSFAKTCIIYEMNYNFGTILQGGGRKLGYLWACIAWFYFIHLLHGVVSRNLQTNKIA